MSSRDGPLEGWGPVPVRASACTRESRSRRPALLAYAAEQYAALPTHYLFGAIPVGEKL